ncbi:MAG TPA: hypothetical protein VFB36_03865 [Nevskiaceae bacterium]|nr:hypothetical protein [Nevskiaceae bacterium]
MAAKKRGPRITTYVLTVNEETGKVLRAHIEDSRTGERKKVDMKGKSKAGPTIVVFGNKQNPGDDSSLPTVTGPITRLGRLHVNTVAPVNPSPMRLPKARTK